MSKRAVPAMVLAALAVLAAGCGGDDEGGGGGASSGGGGDTATVKVASAPVGDVAPLFLGVKQGFFEKQKLTVQEQFVESGAVVVPAVVRGSFQAGFANSVTVMSAAAQGLGLRVVAVASSGGESADQGYEPLMVTKKSGIADAKGLEGKTIAVSSLDSIDQIATQEALQAKGVDLGKVKFIEIPRPDMLAALDSGRVDAATLVEPFAVQADETGKYKAVLDVFADAAKNVPVAVYFTSKEYAEANEDALGRFAGALHESLVYANENPDGIREIIPTYTQISAELAADMRIPQWVPPSTGEWDIDTAKAQMTMLAEAAVEHGVLNEVPDMEELFASYPQ
jgi:NitT/TauT family transport system substrate-binding protein